MPVALFRHSTKGTDMQLKECGGRVPLRDTRADIPYVLVDFPTREEFNRLWGKGVSAESKSRYWTMLNKRAEGSTLIEAGQLCNVSKERVRQIEAKFLRLMTKQWQTLLASKTD